jgi:hypothetical protein
MFMRFSRRDVERQSSLFTPSRDAYLNPDQGKRLDFRAGSVVASVFGRSTSTRLPKI